MKRIPKRLQDLKNKALDFGIRDISFDMTRRHPLMLASLPDGNRIKQTFARTPSDRRSDHNALARLRRLVRGIKPPRDGDGS